MGKTWRHPLQTGDLAGRTGPEVNIMRKIAWLILLAALPLLAQAQCLAAAPGVQYVSPDTLKGMLGDPNLILIDVRHPHEWARSQRMIKGAIRFSPDRADTWGPLLPRDKHIVLY